MVHHLASDMQIDLLRAMALDHLDRTLPRIDPLKPSDNLVCIVDFANYVYANIHPVDSHQEPLRVLVCNFVARNFGTLQAIPEMLRLLREGGDIVIDVLVAVSRCPPICPALGIIEPVIREPVKYIAGVQVCYSISGSASIVACK